MPRRTSGLAHLLVAVLAISVILIGVVAHNDHPSSVTVLGASDQAGQAPNAGAAGAGAGAAAASVNNLAPADGDAADIANPVDTTPATDAPDETTTTLPQYSLSVIPPNSGSGPRIIDANAANMIWIVGADGSLTDSWLVSGRDGVPYPGTYHVMSKARYTHGMLGHEDISMEYATRFAISPNKKNTIDFHAIPMRGGAPMQTEAQLGTWQSGGCVRMTMTHAAWIFNNIPIGYKVVVLK